MTAMTPPPAVVSGQIVRPGEITQAAATFHAQAIHTALINLEQVIGEMPEGEVKAGLKARALRLHNALGRGGQALNAHFQTAQISPESGGGDKDGDG